MWWIVLLSILCFFVFIIVLVLFVPFQFRAIFTYENEAATGKIRVAWGHPLFLSLSLDPVEGSMEIRVLGKVIMRKSTAGPEKDDLAKPESRTETEIHEEEKDKVLEVKLEKTEEIISPKPDEGIYKEELPSSAFEKTTPSDEKPQQPEVVMPPVYEPKDTAQPEVERKPKRESLISRIKNSKALFVLKQERLRVKVLRWIIRVLKSLFRLVKINHLVINTRVGSDDPVILGKVYGYYRALQNGLQLDSKRFKVSFNPVFMQNTFELNGRVAVSTSVARLCTPVAIAVVTFPFFTAGVTWYRLRKFDKKKKSGSGE